MSAAKIKVRRFCLLLSYCGKNYSGMQRNPGTNTIEECLLKALRDSGIIQEEHFVRPQLMYFQRAARTDKGVSAVRQIVSLKLKESITNCHEEVNKCLPQDIKLMGSKRVTGSFDAKNFCDARTYSYLMPSYALCPINEVTKEDYRVKGDILKSFNAILEGFVGVHVFHNFTSGKAFKEDSSTRVIKYMYCSEPFFPCNQNNVEFVVVRVKGQSFMMHQIRKMIGLAIAVVKGFATEDHLKRSMEEPYMDIPKAPGLGLMLEEVHFDRYNRKYGSDGHHEPIQWEAQNASIEKFKDEFIYPVVVEAELKDKSFMNWMKTLSLHSYGAETSRVSAKLDHETALLVHSNLYQKLKDKESDHEDPESKRQKLDSHEITETSNNKTRDLVTSESPSN